MLLCHDATVLLYYYTTRLLHDYTTLLLYDYTAILRYYNTTVLLYHYTTILLYCYTASARSPELHKSPFVAQHRFKFHLLATPDVELLVSALKPDDLAYDLYVEMVTFQPGSSRWTSERQGGQLRSYCTPAHEG